jgi:hypothetical protein
MERAVRMGWTPVPSSRHPELALAQYKGLIERKHEYIERGSLILMERPIEVDQDEKAYYNEQAEANARTVDFHSPGGSLKFFTDVNKRHYGQLNRFG